MHLTVVRHGETNENAAGIVQGQRYGTLSKLGLQQIQITGQKLANRQFDICYSSDLERCKMTTAAITEYHPDLSVIYDRRLRERDMKPLEGQKFTEIEDWDWSNDKLLAHKTAEGETWSELIGRVALSLNDICTEHPNSEVLIVSHGGPIRAMLALLTGEVWEIAGRTMLDNCEVREWDMMAPVDAGLVRPH